MNLAVQPPRGAEEHLKDAWGWMVTQLPGKRHRKLLTRALIADREYIELGKRIAIEWHGRGLPA